ncbi:MAG: DUF6159 family protein [bacterium]
MGRFANSWELTKTSFKVASADKELLILPVLSLLAMVASFALVIGVAARYHLLGPITNEQTGDVAPLQLALAAFLYLSLAFIQTFFAAAVVAGAMERLSGGNPTLGSALKAASRKAGRILVWSAVLATVNILLQMLRERGGMAGRIVAGLGNMAWSLATYFMVPVLLFEEVPMVGSVGRSGALFKKTWGEQVIGNGGVGLVFGLVFMLLAMLGYALAAPLIQARDWLGAVPIIAVFVTLGLVVLAIQAVVQGVYKAALYRFATTGTTAAGFTTEQLSGAYQVRGSGQQPPQ